MDVRKISQRVLWHWNGMHKEVVESLFLKVLKKLLNVVLGDVV